MMVITQLKKIEIKNVNEESILAYFESLNAGEFAATASLFADNGALQPPFEQPIIGQETIASYLAKEATGMQLHPREGRGEAIDNNYRRIIIKGKVQTKLFSVNVGWQFILNQDSQIVYVEVKLLASLQELLPLLDILPR